MAYIQNEFSHLALYSEASSEWGNVPSPDAGEVGGPVLVPVPFDQYEVRLTPENRVGDSMVGLLQDTYSRNWRSSLSGSLTAPLLGYHPTGLTVSLAQYLLAWGLATPAGDLAEAADLPSKGAIFDVGASSELAKRHVGLKPSSVSLNGTEADGISVSIELLGKDEVDGPASPEPPADDVGDVLLTRFEYADVTFKLGPKGGTLATVCTEQFGLSASLNPVTAYCGGRRLSVIKPGRRQTQLSVTLLEDDEQALIWDDIRRSADAAGQSEYAAEIVASATHNGSGASGTSTRLTFTLPRLVYTGHSENRGRGELQKAPLTFNVLKPADTRHAVNLAAALV
ncbi:phage tail tube protein [Alienimonas sp. DA493]|uniref:phage tail tube protein n=1 Tax=Alienimonas sp. DA493 TaxID=3373605 RepID=UPI00375534F0